LKLGSFHIEFIKVNHSIAGAMALSITTQCGLIFHSGDFQIDYTPVDNEVIDLGRISEIGKRGVDLLLCESTNVMMPGFTMSETTLGAEIESLFVKHKQERLIIATFASNTYRLIQIIGLAEKYGRKIVFTGRSMINITDVCIKLGYLKMNRSNIIEPERIANYKPEELCIITTGSQGESLSALTRMSKDEFPKMKIGEGDVVIFSSSPIPGNEKTINRVENALWKKGVTVINNQNSNTHVSGHAREEEIKALHSLIKPKYFIPVHGEHKHLKTHKNLALRLGMKERNILIADIGDQIELSNEYMKKIGVVHAGLRVVDGHGIGDLESNVLKERRQLGEEGVCVAILGINMASGEITQGPDIITRGLIYTDEVNSIIGEAKGVIRKAISEIDFKDTDENEIKNQVKKVLLNYIFKKTERKPIILTVLYTS